MLLSFKSLIKLPVIAVILLITFGACNNESRKSTSPNTNSQVSEQAAVAPERAASENTQSTQDTSKGIKARDFTLTRINGQKFHLSDHYGKVIVLNVWATWCPPCRHEIPDFIELQKELGSKGLLIVGVSVDQKGESVVRPFAKAHHMNYPVMVDNGVVNKEYGPFKYVPTTFVIGRDGYVKGYQPGMLTKEVLKPFLEKLLNDKVNT
jgi:cytochrome c biogenesis protein CcmG/thiol:disulfide interchange protein DsbE